MSPVQSVLRFVCRGHEGLNQKQISNFSLKTGNRTMKTSTAIKTFVIAIAITASMSVSNAKADHRTRVVSSCHSGGCYVVPQTPVLGIYGYATRRGMVVTDVVPGSEACRIGLERGDVIVEIDGRCIHCDRDYDIAMRRTGRRTCLLVRDVRGCGLVTVHAHLFSRSDLR